MINDSDEVFDEFDDMTDEAGPPVFKDEEEFAKNEKIYGIQVLLVPLFLICNPITLGIFWLWLINNVIPSEWRLLAYFLSPVVLGILAFVFFLLSSLIKTDDEIAKTKSKNEKGNSKQEKHKA